MSDARTKRLIREISDCQKDKTSGITITPLSDDMSKLKGTFPGPSDTPYEKGEFVVDIEIPPTYPFKPLKMKFITKVYHPNISSASGAICLDILKDAWSPVLTLKTALVSLQSLLCSPEPSDPQDAEVAKHYMSDKTSFEKTARYWTETYAMPEGGSKSQSSTGFAASAAQIAGLDPSHVAAFVGMGFPEQDVVEVLKRLNYRGANVKNVTDDAVLNALLG